MFLRNKFQNSQLNCGIFLVSVIFTITSCQREVIEPFNGPYDVVLLMGQSNTLAGKGYNYYLDGIDPRVMQLGRFGVDDHQVIFAYEPLQNRTPLDSCIGFALTFSKLYAASRLGTDRKVLIIPCGANGSGFIRNGGWNREDSLYKDAVERTNFVLKQYPGSKLTCILWHQGEAEYSFGPGFYQGAFERMKKSLSLDIKTEKVDSVPFILGGLVPYWINTFFFRDNVRGIDSVLRNQPNRTPFTGFADPTRPFVIEKPDNKVNDIHFDANGQREMGRRYFREYERLTK